MRQSEFLALLSGSTTARVLDLLSKKAAVMYLYTTVLFKLMVSNL